MQTRDSIRARRNVVRACGRLGPTERDPTSPDGAPRRLRREPTPASPIGIRLMHLEPRRIIVEHDDEAPSIVDGRDDFVPTQVDSGRACGLTSTGDPISQHTFGTMEPTTGFEPVTC